MELQELPISAASEASRCAGSHKLHKPNHRTQTKDQNHYLFLLLNSAGCTKSHHFLRFHAYHFLIHLSPLISYTSEIAESSQAIAADNVGFG